MDKKRKYVLLAALGLAIAVVAADFVSDALEQRRTAEIAATRARATAELRAKVEEEQRERNRAGQQMARSLRDPGPSSWLQQELAPLRSALAQSRPRLLIVPPGNVADKPGLDPTARVALARALAASLSPAAAARVADPGYVLRALGDPRTIDENDIARAVGYQPESLLVGTVAFQSGQVSLKLQRIQPGGPERRAYEAHIAVDPLYPERALASIAPDAIRALGFEVADRQTTKVAVAPILDMPKSPLAAVERALDPVTGIWLQQLFGVLHSRMYLADPRPRERLFARSLRSLAELTPDSADRALLEARALLYLGRRSAALKALEGAGNSAEARALGALANSNLTDLKQTAVAIRRPVARLIAQLELLSMRQLAHEIPDEAFRAEAMRAIRAVPEPWQPLIAFYAFSFNAWDYPSPVYVKQVLERDFPIPGYELKDLVLGKAALGSGPYDPKIEAEAELSPLVHVRKWREQHLDKLCCAPPGTQGNGPTLTDYLDLLENTADSFVVGRIVFLRETQGDRDGALAKIKLYDDALLAGGHPGLLIQKGEAYSRRSQNVASAWNDVENLEAVRRVLAWTPYQGYLSAWALHEWRPTLYQAAMARGYRGDPAVLAVPAAMEPLAGDIPGHAAFLYELTDTSTAFPNPEARREAALQACSLSVYDFYPCYGYEQLVRYEKLPGPEERLLATIDGRFAGYPQPPLVKADLLRKAGRMADAEAELREALKTTSSQALYAALGNVLRDTGQFERSAQAYLSYPELKRPPANTVSLSNYLVAGALPLLRSGAGQAARSLIERAAAYHDGSQANLEAQVQVALRQSDGERALERLRRIYQSYPNPDTLNRIASLMFVLGPPDAAWDVLRSNPQPSPDFNTLAPAVVGLRQTRSNAANALAWLASSGSKQYPYDMAAAFRLFAIDRTAELFDQFFEVERGLHLRYGDIRVDRNLADPNVKLQDPKSIEVQAYALSYRNLLRHDYAAAAAPLAPFLTGAMPTTPDGAAMLVYGAYALLKSGSKDKVRDVLERVDTGPKFVPNFEAPLVRAVLAALTGKETDALQELRQAQAHMHLDDGTRLVPEAYQFVQIAEWLAADTGKSSYLSLALAYARDYQLFQPSAAWAYAFEARHTDDARARVRAAAMAAWLDPDSQHLAELPPDTRASAAAYLKKNPPFRKPATAKREAKT